MEPEKKYRLLVDTPFIGKGTVVTAEADKARPGHVVRGRTGKVFCRIEPAGSLFFNDEDLEACI